MLTQTNVGPETQPPAIPDLWFDWCAVTGRPPADRSDEVLARFAQQAHPSRRLLKQLAVDTQDTAPHSAPAWPAGYRADTDSLQRLLRQGSVIVTRPDTYWVLRLKLKRLMFAAALLAPTDQGGLAMTRDQALGLKPDQLQSLRPRLGIAELPASCPRCAVWSWLEVVGTNNGWSPVSVRALGYRADSRTEHQHLRPDPSPEWLTGEGLLPAIDRWGYVDPYSSMHRSSLSVVIQAISELLAAPDPAAVPTPLHDTPPLAVVRHVGAAEEARILARADEVNARNKRLLDDYG